MGKVLFNGFCILCSFSIRRQTYWFWHGKVLRYEKWFSGKAFNLSAHKIFYFIWYGFERKLVLSLKEPPCPIRLLNNDLDQTVIKLKFNIHMQICVYIKAFIYYVCERAIRCVRLYLCVYILRVYVIFFGWAIPFSMYIYLRVFNIYYIIQAQSKIVHLFLLEIHY